MSVMSVLCCVVTYSTAIILLPTSKSVFIFFSRFSAEKFDLFGGSALLGSNGWMNG